MASVDPRLIPVRPVSKVRTVHKTGSRGSSSAVHDGSSSHRNHHDMRLAPNQVVASFLDAGQHMYSFNTSSDSSTWRMYLLFLLDLHCGTTVKKYHVFSESLSFSWIPPSGQNLEWFPIRELKLEISAASPIAKTGGMNVAKEGGEKCLE